jgi:hypothetical protein
MMPTLIRQFLARRLSVFVTCFCEKGDLLSQWRAYARGASGVGYALGFESKSLHGWVQTAPSGANLSG